MADEIDKFVLQYSVDLKDSITRLEKLNEKMNQVEKKGEDSQSGVSKWTKQFQKAKKEIVGASSSVEGFMSGVGKMPAKFLGVAAAIAAIGASIKIASAAAAEFREQRITGQRVGLGELNVEQLQRRYSKASGGNVGAQDTRENLGQLANFQESAFTDVSGMGKENLVLRKLGMSAGKDIDKFISDIQSKFAAMSQEQARAYGDLIGLSRNFTDALREAGKSEEDLGKMTEAQAQRSIEGAKATVELDKALGETGEAFRKMGHDIGDVLLPIVTKGAEAFGALAKVMEKGVNAATTWLPAAFRVAGKQIEGVFNFATGKQTWASVVDEVAQTAGKEVADMNKGVSDETLKQAKNQNDNTRQMNLGLKRDINLFSGAVHTFANAVDQQQAWAAWAGEIGKAAGLTAPANISGGGMSGGATNQYDPTFDQMAKKYGLSKYGVTGADLKAQAIVESQLNPNATSKKGAIGIGQIMPATGKSLGYSEADLRDPVKNIEAMARVMLQNLQKFGNLKDAQRAYNGGWTPSTWGNKETAAYTGKIDAARARMGGGDTGYRYGGESRSRLRRTMVEKEIANRLGLDPQQVQRGEATKGDVAWSLRQMEAGGQNEIRKMQIQLTENQRLTPMQRSQMNQQIQQQQIGLQNIREYGATVQGYSREGGREITVGEMPISVVINEAQTPHETGQAVVDALKSEGGQIVNDRSFPLHN
ncbi:SLT domain-containing tail protein [Burkholderia phage BcepF1]|uniref:SLT domain-containing tail protein n=1 Tax=Burkholderia phage BcepF1 TaxID=2886897 RepID=A1Z006_9CAUD|nr:lytic tail protein [Burkholderia phage BcepF1]ABL96833.1 SLT domain-containing tail protein [Burkholderia phage BcepF1]